MKSKKIALLASILMVTLVVGVYAGLQLSNTLTTSWTVVESGNNLTVWWVANTPGGDLARGVWDETKLGVKNTGVATYTVIDRFTIHADGYVLPENCIKIEYWYESAWVDITGAIGGWGTTTISGHFGPLPGGFPCGPGYNEITRFRYKFDGNAPLTSYTFNAWVEQIP